MPKIESYDLDPYYLNQRRIAQLSGSTVIADALAAVPNLDEKNRALAIGAAYKDLLREWLLSSQPPTFELLAATGALRVGTVFTTLRDVYCRNIVVARPTRAPPLVYAKYEGVPDEADSLVLNLRINRDHLLPGSGGELLRGRVSDVFVVAVVHEVSNAAVTAVPIFIGRLQTPGPWPSRVGATSCEVPIDRIDSFELAQGEPMPREAELNLLKDIPEVDVKHAFAEIIGEEHVPKDYGGETSDLFSDKVLLGGKRVPAAFVFKGPAKFRPMTLAELGKNGDQLVRLATEPADLLVVQHCHRITPAVRSMLRSLCNQVGGRRLCSVVDGLATLRILRAYAKCGFSPSRATALA